MKKTFFTSLFVALIGPVVLAQSLQLTYKYSYYDVYQIQKRFQEHPSCLTTATETGGSPGYTKTVEEWGEPSVDHSPSGVPYLIPNKVRRQVEVPFTEYSYRVYKNTCSNAVRLKAIRKLRLTTGQVFYEDASYRLEPGESLKRDMQFVDNYDPQNAEIGSTVAYKNALGINPDAYNTYLNSVVNSNRGTLIITPTTLRTRISLNPGDRLIIRAEGSIKLGAFAGYGGPDGIDGFAAYSLASNIRHGSLIYVIGNADWQFAGSSKTITASKSGSLLMTVNDKQVDDDEGQFIVNYEIIRSTDGATTSPTPAPSVAASPVRATPVIEQNTNQPYNAPPSRPANSARNVDRSQLLYSGAANRFVNERAIGGKLYLYPDRLEFRSYLFKTLIDEQTILLDQIEQVEFYNPMDIFQNGLIVKTTDGKRQKFVVYGRDRWREEIYKLK